MWISLEGTAIIFRNLAMEIYVLRSPGLFVVAKPMRVFKIFG